MEKNLYHFFDQIQIKKNSKGFNDISLKNINDNNLPNITILTVTYNRLKFFKSGLPFYNFNHIDYPKDKIEWIIIDDSDNKNLEKLLPSDLNIKYLYIKRKKSNPLTISFKRNVGVKYSSTNYIVHMDDDDYYPKFSVKNRILTLLNNPTKKCTGSSIIPVYDIYKKMSYIATDGRNLLFEGTLAYKKVFWIERRFTNSEHIFEGKPFIIGREKDIIELPGIKILFGFVHNYNTRIKSDTKNKTNSKKYSYEFMFPLEILSMIKKF